MGRNDNTKIHLNPFSIYQVISRNKETKNWTYPDFFNGIGEFFPLYNPPSRFLQKPIELPILKFVIMTVPFIRFTPICRRKPQFQWNGSYQLISFNIIQYIKGRNQMFKYFKSCYNVEFVRFHNSSFKVEILSFCISNLITLLN